MSPVGSSRRSRSPLLLAACVLGLLCAQDTSADANITTTQLVEITDVDGLSISPDGRFAVFRSERADIARNTYVLTWHSVDLADGKVREIGSGGSPIYLDPGAVQPEHILWINDGRTVVYRALFDGAIGLWQADVTGNGMAPLVTPDADVEDYFVADQGHAINYTVGPTRDEIRRAERKEYDNGILVDSSVDLSQNLFRGGSINGRMSTQRLVGFWFIRDGLLWRRPRQQHRYDLATGTDVSVGPPRPVPPISVPSSAPALQARSAGGDLATANWNGLKGGLSAVLADGRTIACHDPLCASTHISALVWRPSTSDLILTFTDDERRQTLYLWRLSTNELRKVASGDGLLSGGRRSMFPCAVSAQVALCVAASPASPPRIEQIDLATGKRSILFDPNGEMRAEYKPVVENLRWGFGKGRKATGVLILPWKPSTRRRPLYLNYYLCEGFLRGGEGDEWPIPALLDAGFAIACVNSVPSVGSQDAVNDDRTGLEAVRALIDKLAAQGVIDPAKVAMGGFSHGSEIAMWIATHSNLLAAAGISTAQIEPLAYWSSATPGSSQPSLFRRVWGLGAPDETLSSWKRVSSALNAKAIHTPILFQLPEQEAREMPELYARLARTGTPTELFAYPDEAHIKVQPRHRVAIYNRNLDWFRYWLQDYKDQMFEKADQYRRWDRLRENWTKAAGTAPHVDSGHPNESQLYVAPLPAASKARSSKSKSRVAFVPHQEDKMSSSRRAKTAT